MVEVETLEAIETVSVPTSANDFAADVRETLAPILAPRAAMVASRHADFLLGMGPGFAALPAPPTDCRVEGGWSEFRIFVPDEMVDGRTLNALVLALRALAAPRGIEGLRNFRKDEYLVLEGRAGAAPTAA